MCPMLLAPTKIIFDNMSIVFQREFEGQNWAISPILTLKNTQPAAFGGGERDLREKNGFKTVFLPQTPLLERICRFIL